MGQGSHTLPTGRSLSPKLDLKVRGDLRGCGFMLCVNVPVLCNH